jgi:hypothetical protein
VFSYLLQHGRGEWSAAQLEKFLDAFCSLLELLSRFQGVDSSIRKTTLHVPHELDWEPSVRLQLLLGRVLPLVIQWCTSNVSLTRCIYWHRCCNISTIGKFHKCIKCINISIENVNTFRCTTSSTVRKPGNIC